MENYWTNFEATYFIDVNLNEWAGVRCGMVSNMTIVCKVQLGYVFQHIWDISIWMSNLRLTIVCKVQSWGISMWELHNHPPHSTTSAGHMILPARSKQLGPKTFGNLWANSLKGQQSLMISLSFRSDNVAVALISFVDIIHLLPPSAVHSVHCTVCEVGARWGLGSTLVNVLCKPHAQIHGYTPRQMPWYSW